MAKGLRPAKSTSWYLIERATESGMRPSHAHRPGRRLTQRALVGQFHYLLACRAGKEANMSMSRTSWVVIAIASVLGLAAWASAQEGAPVAPPQPPPGAPVPPPPPGAAAKADEGFVDVEAEGEDTSKELALKRALRAALEKGGKNEIFSNTQVENFQVMHDTIISRAEGIVTDYKVLSEKEVMGGTWKVRIKARVSKKALHDSWGAVQNVLNQVGRPKILVAILEKIDGKPEEQSILETEIEKRLLGSGFDMVEKSAAASVREKEKADAASEDNINKIRAIAKDHDAQIFITGTANANQAGMEELYGVPVAFYNCDVQLKAYYTDSAKLLASTGIPVMRGGARGRKEFSPQAGKMALSFAGQNVVEEIYQQVMSQWATQISAGGELILELQGVGFKQANDLKKAIAGIEGVSSVNFKLGKEIATYHINAKMGAQDLAEKLSEGPFEKMLKVIDLKLNRIQAKTPDAK
jgi:hypothetical protein